MKKKHEQERDERERDESGVFYNFALNNSNKWFLVS